MYIRTKNRIYEVESTLRDNGFVKGYNVGEMAFIRKDQVINQSENLEELCDEYVIPRYQDTFIVDRFSKQICLNHIKCGYGDVYGAIWTDKGLIYVAKMNESGDLEFIEA